LKPDVNLMAGLLAGAVACAAGCGPPDSCWKASVDIACRQPTFGATISAPAEYDPSTGVSVYGFNCLSLAGTCENTPNFELSAYFGAPGEGERRFYVDVSLPAGEGAATYELTTPLPDGVLVGGQLKVGSAGVPDDWVPFAGISGTIVVEHSTPDTFRTSFEMEIVAADQQVFTVTDGYFELSGCKVTRIEPGCVAGN
jgi:hypothetical protein